MIRFAFLLLMASCCPPRKPPVIIVQTDGPVKVQTVTVDKQGNQQSVDPASVLGGAVIGEKAD